MTSDLREELSALAETQTFFPDPSSWDRGRRVRRGDHVLRGAAVLAVVALLAGAGAIAVRPDAVGPAGTMVQDGAIPSVISAPDGTMLTDLTIGRASVAYVDGASGTPVLVDAATGKASFVELPGFPEPRVVDLTAHLSTGPLLAVSPDGRRVAYAATTSTDGPDGQPSFYTSFYRVVDLTTGEAALVDVPPRTGTPRAISWTADGDLVVDVYGLAGEANVEPPVESWTIDPESGKSSTAALTGVPAPGGSISATYPRDAEPNRVVPFVSAAGSDRDRALPSDLYPEGATVTPIGWADDSLLVAQVDAPVGSYVEGEHLVLLTSPDRPESEWTYRILVRDVPSASSLSIAVDLIPDLDGTSSQQLTYDFPVPEERDISWLIGLGVAAGIAVLMALRWLWRRFRP